MKLKLVKMTQLTLPALVGTLALACSGGGDGPSTDTQDPTHEKKDDDAKDTSDDDIDDTIDDKDVTGQGGMGGDSSGNDDDTEDEPDPIVPEVVSSWPADGDAGFLYNDSFLVKFSLPMDTDSVEANYSSLELPADAVTFEWNEDGTELTIVPNEDLKYGTGDSPEEIPLSEYTFGISADAQSADGEPLAENLDVTFSTARYLVQHLEPAATLSGSVRTDGYQTEVIHAGDSGQTENEDVVLDWWYIGLITFDLEELPGEAVHINWAQLYLSQVVNNGTPFDVLGGTVDLYDASFSEMSFDAVLPQLSTPLSILSDSAADSNLVKNVSASVLEDFEAGTLSQFAMSFPETTDDDGLADSTQYSDVSLKVSYFIK